MNHTLQNSILASAVAGATLLFVLLAAGANAHEQAAHQEWTRNIPTAAGVRSGAAYGITPAGLALVSMAHLIGSQIAAGTPGSVLTRASAWAATSAVDATRASLNGHLEQLRQHPSATRVQDTPRTTAPRARSALAMPYFATARALRPDINGEAP